MSLTDKEIALELTKAYLDHLNVRVNNKAMHSHSSIKNLVEEYKIFYKTVSELDKDK